MAIVIFSIADEMRASVIGSRVLDPVAFIILLRREIEETGDAQKFDGEENPLIQIRPDEVAALISSGYGPRSEKAKDHHVRSGQRYLKRERTFPVRGCFATVWTLAYYERMRTISIALDEVKEPLPIPPEGTTHVLVGVEVLDETTGRGNPPWAERVADEKG